MKYIILEDNILMHKEIALYRIQKVLTGELGGWLESEGNLSQDGECWVSGEAMVYGNAKVCDDALVSDSAQVYGSAVVSGSAKVLENSRVFDSAFVGGPVVLLGESMVTDTSVVTDSSHLLHFIIAGSVSVSITRTHIQIGCKSWDRESFLNNNEQQAVDLGFPMQFYPIYKPLVYAAIAQMQGEIE